MSDPAVQAPGTQSRGGEGDRSVAGLERLRAAIRHAKFTPEQAVVRQAMRILGTEFVLGRTIEEALERSSEAPRHSYDMIGAVAGPQPFGGQGLSGTGTKAGGPHYLLRLATENTLTLNTTATGGNAELLSLESDTS